MSRATRQIARPVCPVGCGRARVPGRLLCPACWRQVPVELQDAVNRTLRTYNRAMLAGGPPPDLQRAAYKEARDAAIGAVS